MFLVEGGPMNPDARDLTERAAIVGWRSRRWWRRLERRAAAAHEKELLAALRQLAGAVPEIYHLEACSTSPAELVRLLLPGRSLTLAGVRPAARAALASASAPGSRFRLVDSGRYGRYWWIAVSDGRHPIVVAGSHLLLLDTGGGSRGNRSPERATPILTAR
jgi:hypothetical protein